MPKHAATPREDKPSPTGNNMSRPVPTESEQRLFDAAAEGSWSTPYLDSSNKPVPRYEHAIAVSGQKMMVLGGNTGWNNPQPIVGSLCVCVCFSLLLMY